MAMSPTRLKNAAQLSIYNKLKELSEPKLPDGIDAGTKADIDQSWQDLATAVAESMADIIVEIIDYAEIEATIPASSFCTAATGCVLNPSPIPIDGNVTS